MGALVCFLLALMNVGFAVVNTRNGYMKIAAFQWWACGFSFALAVAIVLRDLAN